MLSLLCRKLDILTGLRYFHIHDHRAGPSAVRVSLLFASSRAERFRYKRVLVVSVSLGEIFWRFLSSVLDFLDVFDTEALEDRDVVECGPRELDCHCCVLFRLLWTCWADRTSNLWKHIFRCVDKLWRETCKASFFSRGAAETCSDESLNVSKCSVMFQTLLVMWACPLTSHTNEQVMCRLPISFIIYTPPLKCH